ncbi:hypothetical protein PpSQ1_26480, partial [Pseudomonas putida]
VVIDKFKAKFKRDLFSFWNIQKTTMSGTFNMNIEGNKSRLFAISFAHLLLFSSVTFSMNFNCRPTFFR